MSKQGHISISETDSMSYMEFTKMLNILTDYIKECQPDLES